MKQSKFRAAALAAAFVFAGALLASPTPTQQSSTQSTSPSSGSTASSSQKIIKKHFMVLHMMPQALQVRSLTDARDLRTFSYSPQIRSRMQEIMNAGGYKYGDRVTVWYGSDDADLALKIKGKPSNTK